MMKAQYRELGRSKIKAALQELVWLDIDEDNNLFILRGKQENLEKAKGMLEEYLVNNSLDELAILDEDFDVLLTGGKTSKIVTLSEELDVNLSADRSKGTINIRGTSDKVAQAKKTLTLFLNGGEGQTVAKLTVTDQLVGTIIGKGGKTRKDLEAKYSPVSIHISKSYKVSIRGPEDKVNECRIEILKMISSARVTQTVTVTPEQQTKLEKTEALKRIMQQSHCQLSILDGVVTVRGFFYDVRDAVSLLNEKLTGEYKTAVELSSSQYTRVSSACRDLSHFQRMESATETKITLETSGEIQVSGKKANVKKCKEQIYDFLGFICPGEIHRSKVSPPLYVTVGAPPSLADVVASVGGTTIYLDRDVSSIVIRDSDVAKVQAAAHMVADKIQDAERLAYVLQISQDEAWLIAYIIGKNGGRIQALQKGSDCHIDISKESRTITVTGESEEKVVMVRENLIALVEKARRENVFLTVPEKAIPAFVGQGGKNIKDWSTGFGVEIQRSRKPSSQFKIVGDETKTAAAKKALEEWILQWEQSNASLEIPVEKQYISAILGLKGATAQAIQNEFDCKIDIDRTALKVIIRGGDPEKRQGASAKVNEIIEKEAAAKAEAAAKRKAERKAETKVVTDEPSGASAATNGTKKENKPANTGNARQYPSHPVGLVPANKTEKKGKEDATIQRGTEQGRNLFNLLVEG